MTKDGASKYLKSMTVITFKEMLSRVELLCWPLLSPQMTGTLFAAPVSVSGWAMEKVIKSSLKGVSTYYTTLWVSKLGISPDLADSLLLFEKILVKSDCEAAA